MQSEYSMHQKTEPHINYKLEAPFSFCCFSSLNLYLSYLQGYVKQLETDEGKYSAAGRFSCFKILYAHPFYE